MILIQKSRFAPGQMVMHRSEGYIGLIYDVDPIFTPDGINETSDSQADRPWYHILVDGLDETAYLSEEDVIPHEYTEDFFHPLMYLLFKDTDAGDVISRHSIN